MYIGVGTLFCVTLPARDQVRHRRQDVRAVDAVAFRAEHEIVARRAPRGLLLHLDVGHAVFGEDAFLLGDEQRRRVGQRDEAEHCALVTSGPAACAMWAPNGKLRLHGAEQRGGAGAGLQEARGGSVPPWACSLFRGRHWCVVLSTWFVLWRPRAPLLAVGQTKKPPPDARKRRPQDSGVACPVRRLDLVSPSALTAVLSTCFTSFVPTCAAAKVDSHINQDSHAQNRSSRERRQT